jgi:hypothetical protein
VTVKTLRQKISALTGVRLYPRESTCRISVALSALFEATYHLALLIFVAGAEVVQGGVID